MKSSVSRLNTASRLRFCLALALPLSALLLPSCNNGQRTGGGMANDSGTTDTTNQTDQPNRGDTSVNLDREYIVGPTAATALDYRIVWQQRVTPSSGGTLEEMYLIGDSIFIRDSRNLLTRLQTSDGDRVWRTPLAGRYDPIHGLHRDQQANSDLLYAVTDGDVLVLETANGGLVERHPLEQLAATPPAVFGPFFIYGARNGQVAWHQYRVGYLWKANKLPGSVRIKPIIINDNVLAVSTTGAVKLMNATNAEGRWFKETLDSIEARPAGGDDAVYVAGLDQHLRAWDVQSGRKLWDYLASEQLVDSPTLINGRLYQQVPGKGLVSFNARPNNKPGGEIIWTAENVAGRVIGRYKSELLVWDEDSHTLSLLDEQRGFISESVTLNQVDTLLTNQTDNGDLYALSEAGRVSRLTPR